MNAENIDNNEDRVILDDDFMASFKQMLREYCPIGAILELKLNDIRGHYIVTTKVLKVNYQDMLFITDQIFKASNSTNLDPGTIVRVSVPIDQGEISFDMMLEKTTHLPSENHFKIITDNITIRKRKTQRIDVFCEGVIMDSRQRVILSMISPLKANFSQSGLRIWLETGNLNVNTDYTISLRLSYSPKDLKTPKFKIDCDWHVIVVKLYGDGVKEPFNYQAAGFFKNHEQFVKEFNEFVQKYQSYKALNDVNRFKTTR